MSRKAVEAALLEDQRRFLGFLVSRLRNVDDAMDVMQDFATRAITRALGRIPVHRAFNHSIASDADAITPATAHTASATRKTRFCTMPAPSFQCSPLYCAYFANVGARSLVVGKMIAADAPAMTSAPAQIPTEAK